MTMADGRQWRGHGPTGTIRDPGEDAVARVLAPAVIERFPRDAPAWRRRRRGLERKWRLRRLRRALCGWIPAGIGLPAFLRGRRTQDYIRAMYENAYAGAPLPGPRPTRKPVPAEWRNEGLLLRRGALNRVHLLFMAEVVAALRPRSVLEVGAGDGHNLVALSARFPGVSWHGVELTRSGVAALLELQKASVLPQALEDHIPWPVGDGTAYRSIDARVGDARDLPFPDGAFDLVMTHLALEQMETIRDAALSEIARVAARHVLFVEPFADFNRTPLRRSFVRAKDYFSLSVDGLRGFGIEPVHVTDAFPQKLRLGQGLVVGRLRPPAG